MNILFLGGLFNKSIYIENSKKNVQNAANSFQWNIINGLKKNKVESITVLNSVFIGSFPKDHKDFLINSYNWESTEGLIGQNVGFINLPLIKHITRLMNISKAIKRWANNQTPSKIILVYSMHTPFLYAIKVAKKINPNIKVCLIIPDLPQFMRLNSEPGFIYTILKTVDTKLIIKLLKYVDKYVLLTEAMAKPLNLSETDYLVIEGLVNIDDDILETNKIQNNEKKKILYTGTLNYKYGILTLLEAFKMIDMDYELQICGAGEAEDKITEMAKVDKRINFLGLLKREEVLNLQRNATCLINPRSSDGEFTKYSFPSKNMEYLLSGRPTIAHKLDGIPNDYDEYFIFIDNNSPASMAEKIIEVCETSPDLLNKFGKRARDFVLKEKNNIRQSEKILKFVGGIV